MLNIVGWSSSFPVITWIKIWSKASSSFGDASLKRFEHDFMYTKYGSYPINNDKKNYLNEYIYKEARKIA